MNVDVRLSRAEAAVSAELDRRTLDGWQGRREVRVHHRDLADATGYALGTVTAVLATFRRLGVIRTVLGAARDRPAVVEVLRPLAVETRDGELRWRG